MSARSRPRWGFRVGLTALFALGSIALGLGEARAGSMDFALERLVADEGCRTPDGQIVAGVTCSADQLAFKRLINQYAMAIAPTAMAPAKTTGYGGFEISLEGVYTSVDGGSDAFRRGTRGGTDPETGLASTENASPSSLMQLYSLRLRKGFGFGLEVVSQFGVLTQTSIISGGVDVRFALLEGFRDGVPGYLPDVAVASSVRTITGTPQVQITVPSVQAVISKPFSIARTGRLTPWVGYQYLWIFGDSGLIDFTPATNAQQYCNYAGPNQPGGPSMPVELGARDGSPVCGPGGSSADFNNTQVFAPVRLERQRLFLGVSYQYEIFVAGAQLLFDAVSPENAQNDEEDRRALAGEPGQWALAFQLGASF